MVNFHIEHGKESLGIIGNPMDLLVIVQTLEYLEALAKLGIEVQVVASAGDAKMALQARRLADEMTWIDLYLEGNHGKSPTSGVGIKRFCGYYSFIRHHARNCHAGADQRTTPGTVRVKKGKDSVRQPTSKLQACKIVKR